ncbi:SDR family NAD(P)-dependent oxidoreductase [Microbacterium sp. Root553]|uniref:SDR family NAD(P)-dependent oxidoreductase n=1 Tax=Microbacterium sp. Root553 TaxID=1736556 RepID=UPI0006FD6DF0|nr:SDR family NAD(P)-dependent oxidoreductase [Microbacterium sp. Root553]KQZ25396.1 dehydrogenase [Microbacterium sp. Root553]
MSADRPLAVLITGASSGIGAAVAARFRAAGARLFLTGRRAQAPADLADGETYLPGDLNDEGFVAQLMDAAVTEFGAIDTVVACHGLQADGALTEMPLETASRVLDANILSVFSLLQHAVPAIRDGGGQIVLVSSRLGMVGIADQVVYTAAKGGLIMLGKGAAIELAARNIRVNVAAPGLTETPVIEAGFQQKDDPEAYRASRAATIPMQRLARPEEVAEAIFFLGSPASSYITGAVLPIDGGYTAA